MTAQRGPASPARRHLALVVALLALTGSAVAMAEEEEPPPPDESEAEGAEEAPAEGEAPAEATPAAAVEGPFETPEALDVEAGLASREAQARIDAVQALGASREAESEARLVALLGTDPSPEVRGWVVRMLGELGTETALEAVRRAAEGDPDQRVRRLAGAIAGTAPAAAAQGSAPWIDPELPGEEQQPERQPVPGRGLVIAGWSLFAGAFGTVALAGAVMTGLSGSPFFLTFLLPGLGPIIFSGLMFAEGGDEGVMFGVLSLLAAGAQAAGLAMLGVGHARGRRARRGREARLGGLALVPMVTGDAYGVSLVGRL